VDKSTMDNVRSSLVAKRNNLWQWFRMSSAAKRQVRLGPAHEAMLEMHIQNLDAAVQKATDGSLGICTVCHESVDTSCLEMDYTSCICLAHFSAEQRQRLETELELASAVQRSLLPHQAPETSGFQVAAYSRPAQIIGGDYFGFFRFSNGAAGLAIADVAGHGVSASLHMASVHAVLQTLTAMSASPADVLGHLQRLFVHNTTFTTFVTIFLCSYDPGTRTLIYANAGHNPPLLSACANDGSRVTSWLRPTAPAIGLVENLEFPVATLSVQAGDTLLLYTDGVVEAIDGSGAEYGDGRLAEILARLADAPAQEILQEVRGDLDRFVDRRPLADDATLVVCKFLEWPPS
jgi:phosphoserine phosphatase RsbU/P